MASSDEGFKQNACGVSVGSFANILGSNNSHCQVINASQKIMNTMIQKQENNCIAKDVVNVDNNTIIVDNSKVGDVGIRITSSVDAACVMANQATDNVANTLTALLQQDSKTTSGLFDFSNASADQVTHVSQTINNNISQILNNTCEADNIINADNNFIYVKNSQAGDLVGLSIDNAQANATCSMKNTALIQLTNQETTQVKQSATFTSWLIAIIGLAITGAIIIAVIKMASNKKSGETAKTRDK